MYTTTNGDTNVAKIITHAVLGIIGLIVVFGSFVIVSPGEVGVVVNLGKVGRTLEAGVHLKAPIVESVKKFDTRTQKEEVEVSAASKDLQTITAKVAVNYGLVGNSVATLYQTVGTEYKARIIDPSIQEAIKSITSRYTAEELITKRAVVRDEIKVILAEKLVTYGIIGSEVSITDFDFSPSFNQAIEAKVTAEQNALASKNKLEQTKYEAEQRIVTAKGEAEAIRIQAQAIESQGGAAYVQLQAIGKWDGVLPQYTLGGATPFINIK